MFTHTLATVIMALSSLLITTAAPIDDATSVPALEFTTSFPEYFCANSVQTLYWRGGSGVYDVQARLHLQGYSEENDKTTFVVQNSTDRFKYTFPIGRIGSEFPAGSIYVFTVNDAAGEVEAASTAAIPIYNC